MLETGVTLQGRYVIEKLLGQGGMGAVYLARQINLGGKRVAIKEMQVGMSDPTERAKAGEQFRTEAHMLAQLEHPNLVQVFDHFQDGDNQYLVMALVDGQPLDRLLDAGPLPVPQVLEWAQALCDVLAYLHGQNPPVIFRDLKPSNIMLDNQGRLRLVDFGIARVFVSGDKTSTFIRGAGTPGYAPVEQFSGGATDVRSDIYALGCTLFTLLTRTVPPVSIALLSGEAEAVSPRALNPEISIELQAVLGKMMGLRKQDRYQTMQEVREALSVVAAPYPAPPVARPTPSSRVCERCGDLVPVSAAECPRCTARPVSAEKPATNRPCPRCGQTVDAALAFCGHCGSPVNQGIPTVLKTGPVPSTPRPWPAQETRPTELAPAGPVPPSRARRRINFLLLLLGVWLIYRALAHSTASNPTMPSSPVPTTAVASPAPTEAAPTPTPTPPVATPMPTTPPATPTPTKPPATPTPTSDPDAERYIRKAYDDMGRALDAGDWSIIDQYQTPDYQEVSNSGHLTRTQEQDFLKNFFRRHHQVTVNHEINQVTRRGDSMDLEVHLTCSSLWFGQRQRMSVDRRDTWVRVGGTWKMQHSFVLDIKS